MPDKANQPVPPLVEGRDYYIDNGRWVFTSRYHLERGFCCGRGCRHCPYDPQHRQGNTIVATQFPLTTE